MGLIPIDGELGEGLVLRAALTLAAVTGQGFEMTSIRARRPRPGLQPGHVAAVRAVSMCCRAEVHGAFDGSPDLVFKPGPPSAGTYDFDMGTAGATTQVLQAVLPAAAAADEPSAFSLSGGTHLSGSPSYHFVARHWAPMVKRLGLRPSLVLERAGFAPRGEGRLRAGAAPRTRSAHLDLTKRGPLVEVRGLSGEARLKGGVARRQAEAARALLWEQRRLESDRDVLELPAASPGSYLQIEAIFENGRAAFGFLGERGVSAEMLGERASRRLLRFLDDDDACIDPWLADQLAVPAALARVGARLVTSELTPQLETVATVLGLFGVTATTFGRPGGPGGLEIEKC
jgi:RNA 3'-phosphate cyclase